MMKTKGMMMMMMVMIMMATFDGSRDQINFTFLLFTK